MARGFILGKFLPPHNGHLFACRVGGQMVDRLTILVCSHDAEPIDGVLRARWMRESLQGPGFNVVHMHRNIPQEPQEHPDFWQIWKYAVLEHHPEPIDWVFGSEPYVAELAEVLGARPYIVDPDRRIVPISGSAIRKSPHRHWRHIPPAVRPYYQKRVTLIGPESVGKSTLAEWLAHRFKTLVIPEYGRDYDALLKHGADWNAQDFLEIARGHLALSRQISALAGPIVIEDTDLLQTVVWAEALLGAAPPQLLELLNANAMPDLYLLLKPDVPWVNDGTRYHARGEQRSWFRDRLMHWLFRAEASWLEIPGSDWAHRRQNASDAIDRAFSTYLSDRSA